MSKRCHEGWRVIPDHQYDDGGFRVEYGSPGLKRFIEDIKAGRIDTVVVYKVDRLSRSLADFAKVGGGVWCVWYKLCLSPSILIRKDSMGRLTLNILLSFAQFEARGYGRAYPR